MDMDQVGHFVRQRRVFVAVSVLLAALYFFCLDLKTLSIFGVDTKIDDPAWVNGVLISLWAYYLYRFRVARTQLGTDWRIKAPVLHDTGRFVEGYVAEALKHPENIEKVRAKVGFHDPSSWEMQLNSFRFSDRPRAARFSIGKMHRKGAAAWDAIRQNEHQSGETKIEISFGAKATWKARALTAKLYLFRDARLGEYYLPTLIGLAWLAIYFLKINYTAGGISIGCGCW